MNNPINLTENLKKLQNIASWFDEQQQVDVEEGLVKVKEAAILIKESKSRLQEIENEFTEIQADIVADTPQDVLPHENPQTVDVVELSIGPNDIPF